MASIRQRRQNGRAIWYLYWRDDAGRQRSRSLGDASESQARIALAAKQIELGIERRAAAQTPTIRAWSQQYLTWHARQYPASHYRVRQIVTNYLVPVFGDTRLAELKRADVEEYKLGRQAAPGTIAKELRTLQALLNTAVQWDILTRNPIKGVRPPQDDDDAPPRYLTQAELAALYDAAGYRAHWWRLLVNTGLRRSEALQLQWSHVERDVLVILSQAGARTKSRKTRAVPLNLQAQDALHGCLDAVGRSHKSDAAYVLPRMAPRSLSRHFEQDAANAGIAATLHDTRHTFCSWLVLRGVHLRKVQQLAGHASISTTERYARLLVDDLVADVRLLEL